ncbi:MAG: DUF488 domain-containing protein [Proteobacteria bacterium]|nr:MAG: DUF488 domain-containing protein [Pseudomonadota bacterium]
MIADIRVKRVYDGASKDDGLRVLVDRIWPRGVTRDQAAVDLWLKEVAPSTALRRWFGHDPDKWVEFKRRYYEELGQRPESLTHLLESVRVGPVTLVYAARDRDHNQAVALRLYLESFQDRKREPA